MIYEMLGLWKNEIPEGGQLVLRPDFDSFNGEKSRMRNAENYLDARRIFLEGKPDGVRDSLLS